MRIYRGHTLVKKHEPREIKQLLRVHGSPGIPYLRDKQPATTWPKKGDDDKQLHLVVLPGEPDDVWPRQWMEVADRVVVVDAAGRDVALLKARDVPLFDHRKKVAA